VCGIFGGRPIHLGLCSLRRIRKKVVNNKLKAIYDLSLRARIGDIRAAEDDIKDIAGVVKNLNEFEVHPKFNPGESYYDISLIKLDSPVQLSSDIAPICLPQEVVTNENPHSGEHVTFLGKITYGIYCSFPLRVWKNIAVSIKLEC